MDLADALGLGARELVSLVGAGGKKTAARRLVDDAGDRSRRAAYTTTVHTPPLPDLPVVDVSTDGTPDEVASALVAAVRGRDRVQVLGPRVPDPDRVAEKARGFAPAAVDALDAADVVDWLLVKADGARRRELKAPADHEPAVPARTSVVVPVVSARAVGESNTEGRVHRPAVVADLVDVDVGDRLTPAAVGRLLVHPAGGLKGLPEGARAVPLVNKADTDADRETARRVAREALARADHVDRVVVASLRAGRFEVVRR